MGVGMVRAVSIYVVAFLLLSGCAGYVTDHPEIERPLRLTEAYMDLYEQYEQIYTLTDDETRQYMRENVAPLMNETKDMLVDYNEIVLAGGSDMDKYRLIVRKMRELSSKLSGVDNGQ